MQKLKPILMLVVARIAVAGITISYKLAEDRGIPLKVLIAYRYLFAAILVLPIALVHDRNKRPKLTWTIFLQFCICALFGGPFSQNLYAKSLVLTSATFVAAFTNLIPPFTFIIAASLRLEKVEIGKISGKAKVIGTLLGVGGAMVLTLYKGHQLNIKSTHLHLLHGDQSMDEHVATTHKTFGRHILGSILAFVYSLSIAIYYILQGKFSVRYPCHYSNTFLFSLFGFIQSILYVVITERSFTQLKLGWNNKLFIAFFQGVCSVLAVFLVMAAVQLEGPLFVSVFNPLVLVFVAIAGFLLLDEKLYVGSMLGSVIVTIGLYLVLWGKSKETKRLSKLTPPEDVNGATGTIAAVMTPETVSMARTSSSINIDEGDESPVHSSRETQKEQEIVEKT